MYECEYIVFNAKIKLLKYILMCGSPNVYRTPVSIDPCSHNPLLGALCYSSRFLYPFSMNVFLSCVYVQLCTFLCNLTSGIPFKFPNHFSWFTLMVSVIFTCAQARPLIFSFLTVSNLAKPLQYSISTVLIYCLLLFS